METGTEREEMRMVGFGEGVDSENKRWKENDDETQDGKGGILTFSEELWMGTS